MPAITIAPVGRTVVVRAGGAVLGETTQALSLTEGSRAPVIYVPREGFGMAFLDRSDTVTTCPHKGRAAHFHIVTESTVLRDAVWSYQDPIESVAAIRDHLAFYPDKVTVEIL